MMNEIKKRGWEEGKEEGKINEGLPIIRGEFGQTPVGCGRDSWSTHSCPGLHVTLKSHSKFEDLTSSLEEQKHMVTWRTTTSNPEKAATMRTKACGPERMWTDPLPAVPRMPGATLHLPQVLWGHLKLLYRTPFCSSLGAKLNKLILASGVWWGSVLRKVFLGGWIVTS